MGKGQGYQGYKIVKISKSLNKHMEVELLMSQLNQ